MKRVPNNWWNVIDRGASRACDTAAVREGRHALGGVTTGDCWRGLDARASGPGPATWEG